MYNSEDWPAHENSDYMPNAETRAAIKEGDELLALLIDGKASPKTKEEFFKELGI